MEAEGYNPKSFFDMLKRAIAPKSISKKEFLRDAGLLFDETAKGSEGVIAVAVLVAARIDDKVAIGSHNHGAAELIYQMLYTSARSVYEPHMEAPSDLALVKKWSGHDDE